MNAFTGFLLSKSMKYGKKKHIRQASCAIPVGNGGRIPPVHLCSGTAPGVPGKNH
jgi:hypothetical protein